MENGKENTYLMIMTIKTRQDKNHGNDNHDNKTHDAMQCCMMQRKTNAEVQSANIYKQYQSSKTYINLNQQLSRVW